MPTEAGGGLIRPGTADPRTQKATHMRLASKLKPIAQ